MRVQVIKQSTFMYFLPSESYTLVSENKATSELQSRCAGISSALENIEQGEKLSYHLYFTQKLLSILRQEYRYFFSFYQLGTSSMMLVRGTGLVPKQKLLYKCKLHRCLVAQERHVYYMLSFIILNNYFCLFCVLNRIGRNKIIIKRNNECVFLGQPNIQYVQLPQSMIATLRAISRSLLQLSP